MDDLHCYTRRKNSVREAEEHSSLVKKLEKKNQNGSLKKQFKPNPHHKTQENQTQTGYSHKKKTPKYESIKNPTKLIKKMMTYTEIKRVETTEIKL